MTNFVTKISNYMKELDLVDNDENIIKTFETNIIEVQDSAIELSKKHTNYFDFIETFNKFVSKMEINS